MPLTHARPPRPPNLLMRQALPSLGLSAETFKDVLGDRLVTPEEMRRGWLKDEEAGIYDSSLPPSPSSSCRYFLANASYRGATEVHVRHQGA